MSDSTTFAFVVTDLTLDAFCEGVAMLAAGGGRCDGAVATTPAAIAALLGRLCALEAAEECLTFAFAEDDPLREFRTEYPELQSDLPGKVAVGCFWVSCRAAGERYAVSFTRACSHYGRPRVAAAKVAGKARTGTGLGTR